MGGAHAHASPRAAPRKQLIEREVFLKAKKIDQYLPNLLSADDSSAEILTQESPNLPPR